MPCYSPIEAYRSIDINPSGKRSLVFNPANALEPDNPLKIPCGKCIGCRLRYSAQWAARCYHESQMWEKNCFVTLTYDEKHLPPDGSISVRDCQLFMKRLRKKFSFRITNPETRRKKRVYPKIRMAYCGEYGEKKGRPHYHFILFNHDFPDKYHWKTRNGIPVYRSQTLEEVWPFGNSEIGSVTYESAAYVARYITKKINGDEAFEHYLNINYETGEILNEYTKEFFKMSRRPGIGKSWLDKYASDVYPSDEVIIDGRKMMPPKYYDSQYEIVDPYTMDEIKEKRIQKMKTEKFIKNNTRERLTAREKVKRLTIQQLKRRFENET